MSEIQEQMQKAVQAVKSGREPQPDPQPDPQLEQVPDPQPVPNKEPDAETLARADGWRPKEEWDGPEDDWVSAKEFNRAKSLFAKIDHEVKARKSMERQLHELRDSFDKRIENVATVARQQALDDLNAKKKEAVEGADYAKVQEIDKQIAETNSQFDEPAPALEPEIRAPVQEFMDQNSWFSQDEQMTQFAISYQQSLLYQVTDDPSKISDRKLEESLSKTLDAVKRAFPDKFEGEKGNGQSDPRRSPQRVEGNRPPSRRREFSRERLTPEEREVMDQMKFYAGMEEDDYIQAIADIQHVEKRRSIKSAPYKSRMKKKDQ